MDSPLFRRARLVLRTFSPAIPTVDRAPVLHTGEARCLVLERRRSESTEPAELKRDTHFYLYCDPETMFVAKPLAEQAGFKFWKPLIWDKARIGMGYHYRARYECILFFEKGKRKLNNLGQADIITCPRVVGGYPAEKPPQVSEVLVRQSTEPGDRVIDPFMGSGSTGVAAVANGRNFLGNDLCAEAIDIARRRLRDAGAQELCDLPVHGTGSQLAFTS